MHPASVHRVYHPCLSIRTDSNIVQNKVTGVVSSWHSIQAQIHCILIHAPPDRVFFWEDEAIYPRQGHDGVLSHHHHYL